MWSSLASKIARTNVRPTNAFVFEYACLSVDSTWRPVPSRQTAIWKLSSTLFASQSHNTTWALQLTREESSKKPGLHGWAFSFVYEAIVGSESLMESALIIQVMLASISIWYLLPTYFSDSLKPDIAYHWSVKWNIWSYPLISTLISIAILILCLVASNQWRLPVDRLESTK